MNRWILILILVALALALSACDSSEPPPAVPEPEPTQPETTAVSEPERPADDQTHEESASQRLKAIVANQPEATQARLEYRRPVETLEFFGIEPGMTVVESLPGGGWYSSILIPYLGSEGRLIGVNYEMSIWPRFGMFDDETIESMRTWSTDWPARMMEEGPDEYADDRAEVHAFEFGSLPPELEGQADAVLFIRALHNLARFEEEGGYLTTAVADTWRVLRPGGIVGVVQHEARPEMSDDWASGARGYIKKQTVIDRMVEAGFELVSDSDLHANPDDQPGDEDHVWRLPPTLATSREDPELRERMEAIGESHRMTLKFRKPE